MSDPTFRPVVYLKEKCIVSALSIRRSRHRLRVRLVVKLV